MELSVRISVALEVESDDALIAIDFLLDNIQLSKSRLKKLMNAGGVWLLRGSAPRFRLRRAMTDLKVGDVLEIYYDDALLDQAYRPSTCLADHDIYSVWYKPAGVFCNGSDWGDHNSLERQVNLHFQKQRPVWLQHWLPAAGRGLVLISHHKRARLSLQELQSVGGVKATYRFTVRGDQRWMHEHSEHPAIQKAMAVGDLAHLDIVAEKYNQSVDATQIQILVDCVDITHIIAWCRALDLTFTGVGEDIKATELVEELSSVRESPGSQPEEDDSGELITLVPIDLVRLSFVCPFTGEVRSYKS